MSSTNAFMNLAQGLESNIGKASKKMEGFNDISQKVIGAFVKTNKELNSINVISVKIGDNIKSVNNSLNNINIDALKNSLNDVIDNANTLKDSLSNINIDALKDSLSNMNFDALKDSLSNMNFDALKDSLNNMNIDALKNSLNDMNIDALKDSLSNMNFDVLKDSLNDMNFDALKDSLNDVNFDILKDSLNSMNFDVLKDSLSNMNFDALKDSLNNMNIDALKDSLSNMNFDVLKDSLNDINIDALKDALKDALNNVNIDALKDSLSNMNFDVLKDSLNSMNFDVLKDSLNDVIDNVNTLKDSLNSMNFDVLKDSLNDVIDNVNTLKDSLSNINIDALNNININPIKEFTNEVNKVSSDSIKEFTNEINKVSSDPIKGVNIEINKVSSDSIKEFTNEVNKVSSDSIKDVNIEINKAGSNTKRFNSVATDFSDSFKDLNKELSVVNNTSKKINVAYDDIGKSKKRITENAYKWNSALNVIKSSAKQIIGIFGVGMASLSFVDAIRGAIELNQSMLDLSYQMGHGAQGAKYLESSIMDITASTGMALGKVQDMTKALVEMKVPIEMVKQLSTDSLRFSEITGAGIDSVAQMTGGLVRMGGLGQKSISNILGNMVQVQRAFGISASEMTHLSNKITDTTMHLRNMGKSAVEIEKFQKGTMKLAGAFASVGLKAEEATQMIDRLLDPSKLDQNALLYAKLGISIEDAISGNIDPAEMARGLQGLGSELKDMAGPQAAALASALGIPLQQLRQMGNMDMSQIQETFGGLTGSSESLTEAQKDQAGVQRNLAQAWEKVKGTIGEIALKIMPIFNAVAKILNDNMGSILGGVRGIVNSGFVEKFINKIATGISSLGDKIPGAIKSIGGVLSSIISGMSKLFSNLNPKTLLIGLVALIGGIIIFRKKFASVATDSARETAKAFHHSSKEIGVEIEKGISSGLEMASEKGSKIFEAKMKTKTRAMADDVQTRIAGGHQQAAILSAAAYQKLLAGENTFGWAKKMNTSTKEWLESISAGGKPLSMFTSYYKSTQETIKENMKMSQVDYSNRIDFLKTFAQEREQRLNIVQTRLADLQAAKDLSNKAEELLELQEKGILNSKDLEELTKTQAQLEELKARGITNSAEQQREFNILSKEQKNISNEIVKIRGDGVVGGEVIKLQELARAEQLKHINSLHKDEIALLAVQTSERERGLQTSIDQSNKQMAALAIEQDILTQIQDQLKAEETAFQAKIAFMNEEKKRTGIQQKLSNEEVARYSEIKKALSDNHTALTQVKEEHSTINAALTEQEQHLQKQKDLHDDINSVIGTKGQGDVGAEVEKGLFGRMSDALSGTMGMVKSDFIDIMSKAGNSVKNSFEAAKEKMNPKNWVAAIRAAGDGNLFRGILKMGAGAAKAMADGIGKAGKAAAQMFGGAGKALAVGGALLAGAFLKSDKGKEVMEKIQAKIAEVIGKLAPTIESLVENLVPTIMGLVDNLMPIIMDLVDDLVDFLPELIDSLMPIVKNLLPVIMDLVKSLLPALMPLFSILIELMVPLIKMLLPPLLKVLGFLLSMLGAVINVIGQMVTGLGNFIPGLKKVGEDIQSVGKGVLTAANVMNRAADRMAGAALELADVMTESERQTELSNRWEKVSHDTSIIVQSNMKLNNQQLAAISVQELGMHYKEQSKRTELATAMAENVLAVRDSIKMNILGEKLETVTNAAATFAEAGKGIIANSAQRQANLKYHAGDGNLLTKDDIEKFAHETLTNAELEKVYLLSRNNSSIEDIAKALGEKGRGQENVIKGLLERWESKTLNFEKDSSFWDEIMIKTAAKSVGAHGVETAAVMRSKEEIVDLLKKSGMTISDDLMKIIEVNGALAIQAIKAGDNIALGNMLEKNAELNADATKKANDATLLAFQNRMITVGGGIEAMGKTKDGRDALEKIAALDFEQISDAGAIAKMEDTLFALLTKANLLTTQQLQELQDQTQTLGDVSRNTDTKTADETVTKLYPAIVDAASSGFVKTEDARAALSNSSPAERAAVAADLQVENLKRMLEGQGFQTDAIKELLEQFRKMTEATVAATKF